MDAAAGDLHLLSVATAAIDQAAPLGTVIDDYDVRPAGAPDKTNVAHHCARE